MGKEIDDNRLVIVDYEYGETASFIRDKNRFKQDISHRSENLLHKLTSLRTYRTLTPDESSWLDSFETIIQQARLSIENLDNISQYPEAASQWLKAKEYIDEAYRKQQTNGDAGDKTQICDDISYFRTDAWYDCVLGERGFRDLYDWEHIIMPKVKQKEQELSHKQDITEEEKQTIIDSWIRTWINEIRLEKKPAKAHVVVGVFPQLPFKDKHFDRMVASWSISAHLFAYLDHDQFMVCWKETARVLADEGEAFIFPLTYEDIDQETILNSLYEAQHMYGITFELLDNTGTLLADEDFYYATTLHLKIDRPISLPSPKHL